VNLAKTINLYHL